MPRVIDDEMVEVVTRTLLGAIDVDGGSTGEQRAVLAAILVGYWGRTDLDVATLEPIGPADAAGLIDRPEHRRRTRQLMVLLELCRHPVSEAQVERVDAYAAAMGESGPGLEMVRDLVGRGAAAASADFYRFLGGVAAELEEPSLAGTFADPASAPAANAELAARLRGFGELPVDTLGFQFVEFYRRNGITLPGEDPNSPSIFVAHDMTHVIAGYEPTGPGEIALGAMQIAIADEERHWIQFLGNLAVHEAGFVGHDGLIPREGSLARAGAPELVAEGFRRGSLCTADFSVVDHLGLVELPLEEVRLRFGVPPLRGASG